jgi:hypothetical protein
MRQIPTSTVEDGDFSENQPAVAPYINQQVVAAQEKLAAKERSIQSIISEFGVDNASTRAVANGLVTQGVLSLRDIVVQPSTEQVFVPGMGDAGQDSYIEQPSFKYINKVNGQEIDRRVGVIQNGQEGISGGDVFLNLSTDEKGNALFQPEFSPRAHSVLRDLAPVLAVAALVIPGIGPELGYAILGAGDVIAGAALAGEIGLSVGLSATAVVASVGAAAISSGNTAIQGGSVEDVIKAGVSAGAASGLNFGMGGGVPGAVTGSVAGTIIKGGDASQVLTNAFAAGVGAGVQGALPENPDAGKIIGSAARTYIATGGNVDQTLLNTAAAAIGTLDQPAKTEQQAQAAVTPASDAAEQERAAREIEAVTQSDAARQQELADYQETLNQYAIDKAIYEQTYGPIETPPAAAAPTPAAEATLPPQTVVAPAPVVSPVVTDLDLVRQVAAQPTPTVDPKALERVIVQGQGANVANVAPVSTEITTPRPDTTRGLAPVEVLGKYEQLPEPGFEEYKPLPEEKKAEVVTDVPSTALPPVEVLGKYEQLPEAGFEEYQPLPPKLEDVTVQGYTDRPPEVVTEVPTSRSLAPVEVLGKYEQLPEPGFEEYKPLPEEKVSEVVTDVVTPPTALEPVTVTPPAPPAPPVAPVAPEVKKEEPKKEEEKKKEPTKETKKVYPTVTSVPPPARPGRQPIITGASPARLLADALAAYRPAGAIEGEESGKQRQNVWNEKSLRLKDALGL